uniref:Uncharacterized protein n=1 Tax=Romanomermis culicivorax TaxID=13658 RepID=A0A915L9E1_ROMCU
RTKETLWAGNVAFFGENLAHEIALHGGALRYKGNIVSKTENVVDEYWEEDQVDRPLTRKDPFQMSNLNYDTD